MAITKTIGGDRLGSGEKMKVAIHNYERSTHDLGNVWRSTMAPGVLVPFYKKICPKSDTWTLDLNELVRTIPATGPLFGEYKLQLDVFQCPIRLYNGILHNNMTKIGMDMKKVKLPKIVMKTLAKSAEYVESEDEFRQISTSALIRYLGQKGIIGVTGIREEDVTIQREINAVPILAYYDIFKNYYSNKQEEYAYFINNDSKLENSVQADKMKAYSFTPDNIYEEYNIKTIIAEAQTEIPTNTLIDTFTTEDILTQTQIINTNTLMIVDQTNWGFTVANISLAQVCTIDYNGAIESLRDAKLLLYDRSTENYCIFENRTDKLQIYNDDEKIRISFNGSKIMQAMSALTWYDPDTTPNNTYVAGFILKNSYKTTSTVKLEKFRLENIDRARIDILRNTGLNETVKIGDDNEIDYYPYYAICERDNLGYSKSKYPMQGMVVKTYQSDYFNNWLSTDWIDGLYGISNITAVDVSDGTLNIDALNLKQKVYNLMNRVALGGGTYEDWQEAVWGDEALRRAESPIYCGGAAGTIAFEEVVSTADTQTEKAGDQPLGSLAGKGTLYNTRGGHVEIRIDEPSYIIGIASITPYIDYSQGNDFDMTEIDTLDDLHKPALDGIGFQDLLLERAAWWATQYDIDTEQTIKHAGGKLPAWMDYMTSVNEVHGDFAEKSKLGFMVLTRDYEMGNAGDNNNELDPNRRLHTIPIKDWTTYINPSKFNYQFADTNLTSQNFWVQIRIGAISRRKMSAKIIPNV